MRRRRVCAARGCWLQERRLGCRREEGERYETWHDSWLAWSAAPAAPPSTHQSGACQSAQLPAHWDRLLQHLPAQHPPKQARTRTRAQYPPLRCPRPQPRLPTHQARLHAWNRRGRGFFCISEATPGRVSVRPQDKPAATAPASGGRRAAEAARAAAHLHVHAPALEGLAPLAAPTAGRRRRSAGGGGAAVSSGPGGTARRPAGAARGGSRRVHRACAQARAQPTFLASRSRNSSSGSAGDGKTSRRCCSVPRHQGRRWRARGRSKAHRSSGGARS